MKILEILKNVSIQIKHAQYSMMIYNCTLRSYEHTNAIKENIFLSFLIMLRKGFALAQTYGSARTDKNYDLIARARKPPISLDRFPFVH